MTTHAEAIARLRDAWSRQEFPDRELMIYGERLGRFPADVVMQAVNDLIDTCIYRPSIGQIQLRIAERTLNLPTAEEAWEIAERGALSHAPEAVQRAAEYVGGRYAILYSDSVSTVRAQFRQAYKGYRETEMLDFTTGGRPELTVPRHELGPTMLSLPETTRFKPRPIQSRWMRRAVNGEKLNPPSEAEKSDAIAYLRDGPCGPNPADDPLYREAELVFAEGAS